MKIGFVAYYSDDEKYTDMAKKLANTAKKYHENCICKFAKISPPGFDRDFFGEAMAYLYPKFSKLIIDMPVMLLGADCHFVKSIESWYKKNNSDEWDLAVTWRKNGSNICAYGLQNYIGIMIFNNNRPNVCRKFWLEWTSRIYDFTIKERYKEAKNSSTIWCNSRMAKNGWSKCWYSDQTALNELIHSEAIVPKNRILHVDMEIFSARKKEITDKTIVCHRKGTSKLK